MLAVILAGGKGARLKPFTMSIPKPLLPLGDVPILEVVLQQLALAGFKRVVLTLGHMSHLFVATIGSGQKFGLCIEYCREEMPLGTAGPLRLVSGLEENFLVMNGDLLTTIDYRGLFDRHCQDKAWGTIALNRREVSIDYGVVEMSPEGLLKNYIEKPKIPYWVSMGINVLNRRCLDFIPEEGKFDMPELMLGMCRAGKPIVCHRTECYWQDIGRFDDYQKASEDFVQNSDRFISCSRQA